MNYQLRSLLNILDLEILILFQYLFIYYCLLSFIIIIIWEILRKTHEKY